MQIGITKTKLSGVILCLMIALMPLNHIMIPVIGAAYQPILLSAVLIYLVIMSKSNKRLIHLDQAMSVWTIFFFIELISILWSENLQRSIAQLIGTMETYIVALFVISSRYKIENKKMIYNSYVFMGSIYIIYALFFTVDQIYTGRKMITFGEYGSMDPNEWCSYMIVPIAIFLFRFFEDKNIQVKFIYACFILLTVYCALLEGSRGGLLALIVTMLIVAKQRMHLSIMTLLGRVFSFFLMLFIIWFYIIPIIPETVMHRFTVEGMIAYGGAGGRGELWKVILNFLLENPVRLLFGVGLYGAASVPFVAHNQLLQVLLDMGFIGLTCYLYFLFLVFKRAREKGAIEEAAFWGMQIALLSLTGYSWLKSSWMVLIICLINYIDRGVGENGCTCYEKRKRTIS